MVNSRLSPWRMPPLALAAALVIGGCSRTESPPEPTAGPVEQSASSAPANAPVAPVSPASAQSTTTAAAPAEATPATEAQGTASARPASAPERAAQKAASAASTKTAYRGDDPCKTEKFRFSAVRAACERGGRPAAKDLMKTLVKKAKERGEEVKCTSCHKDTKAFVLKDNAVDDLKALM